MSNTEKLKQKIRFNLIIKQCKKAIQEDDKIRIEILHLINAYERAANK